MKKILLLSLVALTAVCANAKLKFKSADPGSSALVIVVTDDKAGNSIEFNGATLVNDGKEVRASSIGCNLVNGHATYTMTFPAQKCFNRSLVKLDINGKTKKCKGLDNFIVGKYLK